MRLLRLLPIVTLLTLGACSKETGTAGEASPGQSGAVTLRSETVEVGCGLCIYGMPEAQSCQLAVVVNGKPVLATGTDLDLHEQGLCSGSRDAVVSGRVEGDTLVVSSIEVQ